MSQRLFHLLELRQVELAHLTLIGKRQYLVQSPGSLAALFQRSIYIFDDLLIQHAIEIADPNATTVQSLQQLFDRTRSKHAFNRCFQFRELRFFLNLDDRLLESHRHSRRSEFWSGRRESNPRPTAWKAVTLPLSYSRSKQIPRKSPLGISAAGSRSAHAR